MYSVLNVGDRSKYFMQMEKTRGKKRAVHLRVVAVTERPSQYLSLLFHIRDVPGSNLCPETDYPA
jgi:hypothetical protein